MLRRHSPQPGYIVQQQVRCPKCRGKGFDLAAGWHLSKKRETLEVFIDKGSKDGEKLKFRDKGNMQPGCVTGDYCIVLDQVKHPLFKRKGADLLIKKEIPLVDALCGFNFEIEHLDGRKIVVESKPGEVIKDDCVMVIKGEGFPVKDDAGSNGHLFVEFTIDFPKNDSLSPTKQDQLYRSLTGRQPKKAHASAQKPLVRLGSGERAIEAAHREKLQSFKLKLKAWHDNKLKRYDTDASVRTDRNKKYHNRSGYTAFLSRTIAEKLDKEREKMQSKLAFDADLSTSPRSSKLHAGAAAAVASYDDEEEEDEEAFYLEEVTSALFGQKTDEMRRGAADESDSDDEGGRRGGAQQCHVQ